MAVSDSVCAVEDAIAKGCYSCPQGALAEISSSTNGASTMAAVQCDELSFTVLCKQEGAHSVLRSTICRREYVNNAQSSVELFGPPLKSPEYFNGYDNSRGGTHNSHRRKQYLRETKSRLFRTRKGEKKLL
ncbi:hypothetical protein Aduo_005109 [Ancylostoma duodenale]